jgi:hypothetical protein
MDLFHLPYSSISKLSKFDHKRLKTESWSINFEHSKTIRQRVLKLLVLHNKLTCKHVTILLHIDK